MKIGHLSAEQQSWFVETIARMAYPVYCSTGVQDYDYHFIGTGFILRWAERIFFVLTDHQVKLAGNGTIFFAFSDAEKGILLNQGKTLRFEHSDLVISELQASENISQLRYVEAQFLKQPDNPSDLEYIVVGYQRAMNVPDWENKLIKPKVGAVISYKIRIGNGTEPIELDFSTVPLNVDSQFETFEDLTQGLSGAPIFGFKINSASSNNAVVDFHFMGIATFVAETQKTLYGTRSYELLDCLNTGFQVFAEFETAASNRQR